MNFEEKIKEFTERVEKLKQSINTEEATKTSLIMPFFSLLGYDVFNPYEFIPEYVADVGIKKGEKVDYAINIKGKPTILIEAKSVKENLQKHDSQLFRYFGTTTAKIAILTNGIKYKFYTDLEETNKMDTIPFLEINLLELKENDVVELKKFCKETFDINTIINSASNLKYVSSIEKILSEEFINPSDDFIKLILNKGVYEGVKTQNIIEKYRPILKKSVKYYINTLVNQKLQNALNNSNVETSTEDSIDISQEESIVTTNEELESYYIVKSILSEFISPNDIYYKDTYSYFGILYENKVTKWICRVYLKESVKFVIIPDKDKNEVKYEINEIIDIYKLRDKLIERLNIFLK
ncbi:MAG: type I restriction enzyme HsdR N-terminal domain-containing protein [Clostridia bacterium]|nr:type I restriction enzyme HsdR N-terminal domain-containing protein [Clostridia bacterium]